MIRPLLALAAAAALTGCSGDPAPAGPAPETSICVRTTDNVRVGQSQCSTESEELIDGKVRWLDADPRCLDADDYTEIGEVADDDYVEGCAEEPVVRKTTAKKAAPTTTKKAAPTTTKKRA